MAEAENPIRLEVVTPTGIVFSDMVRYIQLPAACGSMGILANHAPLVTTLVPGVLKYENNSHAKYLAVSSGFVEVNDNVVIILAHTAEDAEKIDLARAEAALNRARQRLSSHEEGTDMAKAEAALQRAVARIKTYEMKEHH